jgi:peptidoglycan/LPS O-acetylase OafA/YrhL
MTEQPKLSIGENNFDFLRFLFASLVVFSHSFPLGSGSEDREPLAMFTHRQLTFGSLAVDCFFIISGFLISHSWVSQPRPWPFLRKRIRRIYPGFVTAVLIGAFVITPLFSVAGAAGITLDFGLTFVAKTLRLLQATPGPAFQNNPASGTVNGSLWSISYEFWCYVGVMACGAVGLLRRPRLLAGAVVGAMAIGFVFSWFQLTPGGSWLGRIFGYPPFWARLLPYFLVGMAFYAFRDRLSLSAMGATLCAISFVVASWIPFAMIFVFPVIAAYLIFWFAFLPLAPLNRFAKFGDFSYGIYLYSFPVLQMIVYWHGARMSPLALFAIGWPASILAATLSWHLVERRWLRSSGSNRASAAVPVVAP